MARAKYETHPERRFFNYITVSDEDCWLWDGGRTKAGYGIFWHMRSWLAHRFAYEMLVGPIAKDLQLDHLCGIASCVNPEHLEPVIVLVNIRRAFGGRTHCKHGHEFTVDNTYIHPKRGTRHCIACQKGRG